LIVRGFTNTKISALKVVNELDAGDIYLKKDLSLNGTAGEIFERADKIIESMIVEIIEHDIKPTPQEGEPYVFKRRKPDESNIEELESIKSIYDYIRMLDADGYPHAFIETEYFKYEFTNATLNPDKSIIANVRIIKK
jgi:methionyl-tRNA formyltransferase